MYILMTEAVFVMKLVNCDVVLSVIETFHCGLDKKD